MAEKNKTRTNRLIDWIILVFVLVVMALLITDLSDNVRSETKRHSPVSSDGR